MKSGRRPSSQSVEANPGSFSDSPRPLEPRHRPGVLRVPGQAPVRGGRGRDGPGVRLENSPDWALRYTPGKAIT